MIETLISSKTRVKLLLKFFLNSNTHGYLRGLEAEFGESSNAIRVELNRFSRAGMLSSYQKGNKKYFKANTNHPLFQEIHNIILKYVGIDKVLENVIENLGDVNRVFLTGEFAKGIDSPIIDLLIIGEIDKEYLLKLVVKAEGMTNKKIRYMSFSYKEWDKYKKGLNMDHVLLLWKKDNK